MSAAHFTPLPEAPAIPLAVGIAGQAALFDGDAAFDLLAVRVAERLQSIACGEVTEAKPSNSGAAVPLLVIADLSTPAGWVAAAAVARLSAPSATLFGLLPAPAEIVRATIPQEHRARFDAALQAAKPLLEFPQTARGIGFGRLAAGLFAMLRTQVRLLLWDGASSHPDREPFDSLDALANGGDPILFLARSAVCGRVGATEPVTCAFYSRDIPERWRPAYRRLDPAQEGMTMILAPNGGEARVVPWMRDWTSPRDAGDEEAHHRSLRGFAAIFGMIARANAATSAIDRSDVGRRNAPENLFQDAWRSFPPQARSLVCSYSEINWIANQAKRKVERVRRLLLGADVDSSRGGSFGYSIRRFGAALCSLTFLASLFFAIFAKLADSHLPHWQYVWLDCYLVVVAAALGAVWYLRAIGAKDDAEDFRALAEAIRVQIFWNLAGIETLAADHFPRGQKTELLYVRAAAQNIALAAMREQPPPPETIPIAIKTWWLQDQMDHFAGAGKHEAFGRRLDKSDKAGQAQRAALTTHALATGVIRAGLALTFALLGIGWLKIHSHSFEIVPLAVASFLALAVFGTVFYRARRIGRLRPAIQHGSSEHFAHEWERAGIAVGAAGACAVAAALILWQGLILPRVHESLNAIPWWPHWTGTFGLRTGWDHLSYFAIAAVGLVALLGGIFHAQTHTRGDAEEAREFAAMGAIFRRAHTVFESLAGGNTGEVPAAAAPEARKLLRETGRLALAESGRLLFHRRHRPIDLGHTQ